MTRRVETRVAVQCDRGCVMTGRRAVSVAAVVAGVALVTAPMVLPAAGVTPPPMPAATPTGDWVPGWPDQREAALASVRYRVGSLAAIRAALADCRDVSIR